MVQKIVVMSPEEQCITELGNNYGKTAQNLEELRWLHRKEERQNAGGKKERREIGNELRVFGGQWTAWLSVKCGQRDFEGIFVKEN